MENNITLQHSNFNTSAPRHMSMADWLKDIKNAATTPVEWMRRYYSQVLRRNVSTRQTLQYLHVQAAFAMAVFPAYESIALHVLAAAWFAAALMLVRTSD